LNLKKNTLDIISIVCPGAYLFSSFIFHLDKNYSIVTPYEYFEKQKIYLTVQSDFENCADILT
jgi:hypothetical protein